MIQHGGEAQNADHLQQSIYGPSGEDVTILSEFSICDWYNKVLGDCKMLG
jgi:hypothetical protein